MAATTLPLPCFVFCFVLFLCSSLPPASAGLCNKDDKKALLAFKAAFNDAFATWNNAFACCDWYGVECDANGRVTSLDVGTQAPGTISPAIGDLPFLDDLRLHKLPNLVGTIPSSITKLKKLRFLTISWTNVSGPVPSFLSELPSLISLDLSFGNFSGPIPDSLGDVPRLYALDLSRNKLTGALPPTLFKDASRLTSGVYLILSHNNLSGKVPPSYGQVPFIRIDLSRNRFSGDPSATLFGASKQSLEEVDLSRNTFDFDLSKVELPENLILVDLNHNEVFGSIPRQVANLANFQFFNVSYNRLCGEIPTGGHMDRFDESCYLHNKCLCGTPFPPCK